MEQEAAAAAAADRSPGVGKDDDVPKVNSPEKIVFVLDLSSEMEDLKFRARAGDVHSALIIARRCISLFVRNKCAVSSRTQFGLISLHDTADWMLQPSGGTTADEVVQCLAEMDDVKECSTADLGSVFQLVLKECRPPVCASPLLPPDHCVRVVLLYGRSHCVPDLPDPQAFNILNSSPYFFFDALYLHKSPDDTNNCHQTFEVLCDLDAKGNSYVFETSSNLTRAYNHMAQLLAHPLQRPAQKDTFYKISPLNEPVT